MSAKNQTMRIPARHLKLSDSEGAATRAVASEALVGKLLGMKSAALAPPYREGLALSQDRLRQGLVEAGRARGAGLDVYAVLRDVVGADALVHCFALGESDLLLRRLLGAAVPGDVEGQRIQERRESNPPFVLLHRAGPDGAPAIPVIVAPDPQEPGEYTEWAPYELAMKAAGATDEGVRAFRSSCRHKQKRMRVRIEGNIQRVYCVPFGFFLIVLRELGDHPNWVKPESRAWLASMHSATEEEPIGEVIAEHVATLASVLSKGHAAALSEELP